MTPEHYLTIQHAIGHWLVAQHGGKYSAEGLPRLSGYGYVNVQGQAGRAVRQPYPTPPGYFPQYDFQRRAQRGQANQAR